VRGLQYDLAAFKSGVFEFKNRFWKSNNDFSVGDLLGQVQGFQFLVERAAGNPQALCRLLYILFFRGKSG
jgi:hypothetical protein